MLIPRFGLPLLFWLALFIKAGAQLATGANRPDVSWHQIGTSHFLIVYHDGLEDAARQAADVAEAVYPVVTGNLRTEIPGRTLLYLSDLDDVPNAFAFGDDHMYIWMRGILDDMQFGGIRSSGHAKWFRAVITHEFTHIVIAHATRSWQSALIPSGVDVPRWFNEGTARFMEPDGWTADIDQVLRVAAVNGGLEYNGLSKLNGYLLYETGHSIVRYMTQRFGDSTLARILSGGRGSFGGYNFDVAVREATGESMGRIYADWYRTVTVLYGSVYGEREETGDIAPPLLRKFDVVSGVRYAPDRSRLAMIVSGGGRPEKLYMMGTDPRSLSDSGAAPTVLSDEPGFDDEFSWSPDGSRLVLSKQRFGGHGALVHDLYILDVASRDLRRLTSNAAHTDPAWSPDGRAIVAVEKRIGRDNLVLIDPASGARTPLTSFTDDIQLYTPAWSPDGRSIAFSMFDADGVRAIAIINRDGSGLRRLVADSVNNRYPVWSPDGSRIAFTSHANGIPNIQIIGVDGSDRHAVTDVAGGLYTVQWMPGSDSIVAISFDSHNDILPHLIPAGRRVTPRTGPRDLREKYMAWRTVKLPLVTPPAGDIARAEVEDLGGYSSLVHIAPTLPILPWYGGDLARSGDKEGSRLGIYSLWNDPMSIHTLLGYADYGTASRTFGGELTYINNYLPVTITLNAGNFLAFEDKIADRSYYQLKRSGSIAITKTFTSENSLRSFDQFTISGGFRSLEPWNLEAFAGLPAGQVPVPAKIAEIGVNYLHLSPHLYINGSFRRAEPALGSTHQYSLLEGHTAFTIPFGDDSPIALRGGIDAGAQWGAQLPQEFLGIDAYDQFEGRFNLATFGANYRVRGVRRYIYGDRVAVGSIGIQHDLAPFPSAGSPKLLLFAEGGSAWYAAKTSLKNIPIIGGYGAELRLPLLPGIWLTGGIAFEMKDRPRRDLYLRFSLGL